MIKIEVKSTSIIPRTITPKTGPNQGKPMVFHEQEAWAYCVSADGKPQPYPQRITLNIEVDRGQVAYNPGFYQVSPRSVYVDRFAALSLGRLILDPLPAAVAQPARAA